MHARLMLTASRREGSQPEYLADDLNDSTECGVSTMPRVQHTERPISSAERTPCGRASAPNDQWSVIEGALNIVSIPVPRSIFVMSNQEVIVNAPVPSEDAVARKVSYCRGVT